MSAPAIVIPVNAGIQFFAKNIVLPTFLESFLDPGVRRDDEIANFFITVFKQVWNNSNRRYLFKTICSKLFVQKQFTELIQVGLKTPRSPV